MGMQECVGIPKDFHVHATESAIATTADFFNSRSKKVDIGQVSDSPRSRQIGEPINPWNLRERE
ncbi:hypothetical protein [Microbacterium sp. YY-01]|uniref:hypothetical protein n=1 Tax=Microbacterium sp. YY-01 TaxID=3421634 RepID=UPI003D17F013